VIGDVSDCIPIFDSSMRGLHSLFRLRNFGVKCPKVSVSEGSFVGTSDDIDFITRGSKP